jgi:hypothetical protein
MRNLFMMLAILATAGCTITRTPNIETTKEIPIDLGNQSAKACSVHLLGIIGSFGDNSIGKVARSAGISTITYYEKSYNYYILWGESCNTIYGNSVSEYSPNRNRWRR